jgi:hypothetical protein
MASKFLAAVFAVAVLSVGGYTYWHYADGSGCCGTQAPASESTTGCPANSLTLPCCQEPSRTSGASLSPGEACCEGAPAITSPEVLTVVPREVK